MKKWLCMLLLLCLPLAALAEPQDVLDAFLNRNYALVESMLSDEVRAMIGAEELKQAWEGQLALLGDEVSLHEYSQQGGAHVFTLLHENGAQNLIVVLDGNGRVTTLLLQPAVVELAQDRALPDGVTETDALLFAATPRELSAKILRPAAENAPYAVLVQGSGPSDMDETIGANKPLRDLADQLAALGVGSIRFDKVTFAHPELPCETVEQEYLEPVAEALRVLKETTGAEQVYVIGHSQGGMLMPWLVQRCGFDGGAALAGTPMKLWEISYRQNLDLIALMPSEQQAALLAQVEAERERAENLAQMTDEEARQSVAFGMNAYYLKHMSALDAIAIAKEAGKPMLFLWGENDVQVSREAFEAWQEGLGDAQLYSYRSFPGLNHLFMPSDGSATIATVTAEYGVPSCMDAAVAQTVAEWIK